MSQSVNGALTDQRCPEHGGHPEVMALIAGPRKAIRPSGASKRTLDDGTIVTVKRDADLPEDPAHGTGCSRDTTEEDAVAEDLTATGRRKRKDTGSVREKARPWSEDEEKLFLASLEIHGRALSQI